MSSYERVDAICDDTGDVIDVAVYGGQVCLRIDNGSVWLDAERREQFAKAWAEAERRAEAHGA